MHIGSEYLQHFGLRCKLKHLAGEFLLEAFGTHFRLLGLVLYLLDGRFAMKHFQLLTEFLLLQLLTKFRCQLLILVRQLPQSKRFGDFRERFVHVTRGCCSKALTSNPRSASYACSVLPSRKVILVKSVRMIT